MAGMRNRTIGTEMGWPRLESGEVGEEGVVLVVVPPAGATRRRRISMAWGRDRGACCWARGPIKSGNKRKIKEIQENNLKIKSK